MEPSMGRFEDTGIQWSVVETSIIWGSFFCPPPIVGIGELVVATTSKIMTKFSKIPELKEFIKNSYNEEDINKLTYLIVDKLIKMESIKESVFNVQFDANIFRSRIVLSLLAMIKSIRLFKIFTKELIVNKYENDDVLGKYLNFFDTEFIKKIIPKSINYKALLRLKIKQLKEKYFKNQRKIVVIKKESEEIMDQIGKLDRSFYERISTIESMKFQLEHDIERIKNVNQDEKGKGRTVSLNSQGEGVLGEKKEQELQQLKNLINQQLSSFDSIKNKIYNVKLDVIKESSLEIDKILDNIQTINKSINNLREEHNYEREKKIVLRLLKDNELTRLEIREALLMMLVRHRLHVKATKKRFLHGGMGLTPAVYVYNIYLLRKEAKEKKRQKEENQKALKNDI